MELLTRRQIRRSLTEYARYKGFEPAPHHRLIIRELEDFVPGDEHGVLLLHAPPGSAKSTYVSVLFPAWAASGQNNVRQKPGSERQAKARQMGPGFDRKFAEDEGWSDAVSWKVA